MPANKMTRFGMLERPFLEVELQLASCWRDGLDHSGVSSNNRAASEDRALVPCTPVCFRLIVSSRPCHIWSRDQVSLSTNVPSFFFRRRSSCSRPQVSKMRGMCHLHPAAPQNRLLISKAQAPLHICLPFTFSRPSHTAQVRPGTISRS